MTSVPYDHSVVWYSDSNNVCSTPDCENMPVFYFSGMRIHDSCNCGPVSNAEGEDYDLTVGSPRACLETDEVGLLLCYDCLRLFNPDNPLKSSDDRS